MEATRTPLGAQFACVTGTKVQILTQKALWGARYCTRLPDTDASLVACFTGTKVQTLTSGVVPSTHHLTRLQAATRASADTTRLLYWYKNTNTDEGAARHTLRNAPAGTDASERGYYTLLDLQQTFPSVSLNRALLASLNFLRAARPAARPAASILFCVLQVSATAPSPSHEP
jgi:hypothetical protein